MGAAECLDSKQASTCRASAASRGGAWAPHWYHNVEQSTGFGPYRPSQPALQGAHADLAQAIAQAAARILRLESAGETLQNTLNGVIQNVRRMGQDLARTMAGHQAVHVEVDTMRRGMQDLNQRLKTFARKAEVFCAKAQQLVRKLNSKAFLH